MRGKISIDSVTKMGHGDGQAATLHPKIEDIEKAFDIALIALNYLEEKIGEIVEVVKIYWLESVPGTLVLHFEVILIEPRLCATVAPAKFRTFMAIDMGGIPNTKTLVTLLVEKIRGAIQEQAEYHQSIRSELQDRAKGIGV